MKHEVSSYTSGALELKLVSQVSLVPILVLELIEYILLSADLKPR
jgi:hypothetical protein